MGDEEERIILPALRQLRDEGIDVAGPLPADTMFHERARAGYDAALCMYHDQALVPIKTLHFDDAVNVTLGLPFVRTSPDHGTALDIAGSGRLGSGPASPGGRSRDGRLRFRQRPRQAHAGDAARAPRQRGLGDAGAGRRRPGGDLSTRRGA
jgi:hypothetical protein